MLRKATRVALAAALATGGALAVTSGPASAAVNKCYVGWWKTAKVTASITGMAPGGHFQNVKYQGMSGIKLRLEPGKGRLVYDFTGSKRETFEGKGPDGKHVEGWEQLTGLLTLPATFTGDAKGVITSKNKKAKGPATGTGANTKPKPAPWGTWKVAAHAKIGHFDTPVLKKATFTCVKGKSLVIKDVRKWSTFTEQVTLRLKPYAKK